MTGDADFRTFVGRSVGKDLEDRIFESRSSAEYYLTSPDANVRCAALAVIERHWGPDDSFKKACERLILEDPDPDVRGCALGSFFVCYYESDRARVGTTAALLVYDNSQPRKLRLRAYELLFRLYLPHRITIKHLFSPGAAAFRFPEDVDWKFVDSLLYPDEGGAVTV